MPDSQRRSPGDTGYDPTTDPDSDQYGQNQDAGGTPPPASKTGTTFSPILGNPVYEPGYQGPRGTTPSGLEGGTTPDSQSNDPLQWLGLYLTQYSGNPQQAIDELNKRFPNNPLAPKWYPDTQTIGLANGTYLVAPGTGGNAGKSTWETVQRGNESGGNTGVGAYSGLQRPDAVASPYNPATWSEKYTVPSVSDLTNDPGYQADEASVQRGFERGAAAKGTLLSGGFIGRTLPRAMNDFTSTAYKNLNDRNFANYQQRYGQFLDQNNLALGARQLNENDYNADVTNNLNQYLTRYGAYQDLIKNNLSYANLGLNATTAGAPK